MTGKRVRRGGVKVVRKVMADGRIKVYRYAPDRAPLDPPAIQHLLREWKASPEWRKLAPNTQRIYTMYAELIHEELGWMRISDLDARGARRDFYELRDKYAATPAKADLVIAVLQSMLAWALRRELIESNRAHRIEKLDARNRRADIILPPDHVAAILSHAGSDLARIVRLALLTGIREGDLMRLTADDIRDGWLTLTPQKTRRSGIVVEIPVAVLGLSLPAQGLLLTRAGQPWTDTTLRRQWDAAIAAAGVPAYHFHDLRGTLATRLYEAGCTDAEVRAVLGKPLSHGSMNAYAKANRRLVLAAYEKLTRAEGESTVISLPGNRTPNTGTNG